LPTFFVMIKIQTSLFLAVAALSWATSSIAQPFSLPKLGYDYNALEPHLDAKTMEIHHSKHHQAYVSNLNKAITGTKAEQLRMEDLLITAGRRSDAVRNNAGGHYNHQLFWEILSPKAQTMPSGALKMAIEKQYGSLDSLKKLLTTAGSTRFGSGWAWLIVTPSKQLQVCSTPNQDNPIMDAAKERGIPVLGIDVWEHAYYLKYQNKRGDYLNGIWNVLDWGVVGQKYEAALNDPLLLRIEKDTWQALKEFHMVMAQTFHPAEEGNLKPIRERSGEMLAKAQSLATSAIPASFDKADIKKAIADLIDGAQKLDKTIRKKGKDAAITKQLTDLHEVFHTIQGLCTH